MHDPATAVDHFQVCGTSAFQLHGECAIRWIGRKPDALRAQVRKAAANLNDEAGTGRIQAAAERAAALKEERSHIESRGDARLNEAGVQHGRVVHERVDGVGAGLRDGENRHRSRIDDHQAGALGERIRHGEAGGYHRIAIGRGLQGRLSVLKAYGASPGEGARIGIAGAGAKHDIIRGADEVEAGADGSAPPDEQGIHLGRGGDPPFDLAGVECGRVIDQGMDRMHTCFADLEHRIGAGGKDGESRALGQHIGQRVTRRHHRIAPGNTHKLHESTGHQARNEIQSAQRAGVGRAAIRHREINARGCIAEACAGALSLNAVLDVQYRGDPEFHEGEVERGGVIYDGGELHERERLGEGDRRIIEDSLHHRREAIGEKKAQYVAIGQHSIAVGHGSDGGAAGIAAHLNVADSGERAAQRIARRCAIHHLDGEAQAIGGRGDRSALLSAYRVLHHVDADAGHGGVELVA